MIGIILSLIFLILSFYMIIIYSGRLKRIKLMDENTVSAVRGYFLLFIIILLLFNILLLAAIYNFYHHNVQTAWLMFSIATFFEVIAILGLLAYSYEYQITEKEVIIQHILYRSKKITIEQIKYIYILSNKHITVFLNKYNKVLFSISMKTKGLDQFLTKLRNMTTLFDYNSLALSNNSEKIYTTDEVKILTSIGQQYRCKYPRRVKNAKIQGAVSFLIFIGLIVFVCLLSSWYYIIFIIFTPIVITGVYIPLKRSHDNDLKMSDFELGIRYYYQNKLVKGSHKYSFKIITYWCVGMFIIGLIIGTIVGIPTLLSTVDSYEDMTYIEGTLKYGYSHYSDKNGHIAIAINEKEHQYRLSSIYIDYFDENFFDEVKIGDKIFLYIEERYHNGKYEGRNIKIGYFYYLKANNIEYFGYDDMVKGWTKNHNFGLVIAYIFSGISITSLLVFTVSYVIYLKKRNIEVITI